jgi:outer membrane protein OmpA-like peptidoglycan-associated protein/sugar lactone lactonase YvrE
MIRYLAALASLGGILSAQNGDISEVTYRVEVGTAAGSGRAGYKGGPALESALNRPNGIVVGKDGTIYFSDDNNHCVRKVTPDGRVMLVAGAPRSAGFEDGDSEEALFNSPHGLALDPQGNLYVCDYFNHAIRKITPEGRVTTIAGGGGSGFDDGPAKEATFSFPIAIVRDSRGNLYVLETGNHALRKITPQGRVLTVAGQGSPSYKDGSGKNAAFNTPVGLAIDKSDYLYIVDAGNRAIRKVSPNSEVTTFVDLRFRGWKIRGSLGSGLSFSTANGQGGGVAVDADGNLYIADGGMHCVYQINATEKTVEILAGTGRPGWIDGNGKFARFYEPVEICLGEKPNVFYVCDYRNAAIRKITIEKLEKYRRPTPPADTASAPEPTPVRFQVLEMGSRNPLREARLVIRSEKATTELLTNAKGEATTALLPGRYTIEATLKGYQPNKKVLTLPVEGSVTLFLAPLVAPTPVDTTPPPTSVLPLLQVTVLDERTQKPVEGAQVRWLQGDKLYTEALSSPRGETSHRLAPDTYQLLVDKKGYFPHTQTVTVGGSQTLTIILKPALIGEVLRETRIYFRPNSPELDTASYTALDRIVAFLRANPTVRLRIHGHTDIGDPNPRHNQQLSEARANNVRAYLIQKGISANRLEAMGHGNTKPIADNSTLEGRAQNRRVEFEVIASP